MKTKTKRKLQNFLFGWLVFIFVASTYFIYAFAGTPAPQPTTPPALNQIANPQAEQPPLNLNQPGSGQIVENGGSQPVAPVKGTQSQANSLQGSSG